MKPACGRCDHSNLTSLAVNFHMVSTVCRYFAKWSLGILLNVVVDLSFRKGVNVNRRHDSRQAMVLCCQLWTVVQGALWHGWRTKKVTNHESQISNFHFSFESHNQHVKYRFLCCAYAKRKVVKEFLKNSSKVAKRKSKTANSNLQKFINFI